MDDCCGHGEARYGDVFDERFAGDLERRYRRRGLTRAEQRVAERVERAGVAGTSVLEVGGGIGAIQLELFGHGAAHSINLELSPAYEGRARALLAEAGRAADARRIVGIDLAIDGDDVPVADHVVLHRVVCCYPDAVRLLAASAAHARRTVVFSHPPRTWLTRAFVGVGNVMMRLRGEQYRGYVHSPGAMYDALRRAGFTIDSVDRAGWWRIASAHRA
ncbi:methyltransferase domain-containing protein [Agromyces kandeliae]|uniref:SAM-dependent methyltransferase n=1 Tax=Agromyces kandeliae TaxID=2666141 RepID=UPI0018A1DF3C|nr:SAM-dependent methyltransferase [Agromyces kandeliae]